MLIITVYDVEHGNCAHVVTPNGESIVIDAGHNSSNDFRPWRSIKSALAQRGKAAVMLFINSNADHDHVSDLHDLHSQLGPVMMRKNPTINSALIREIKEAPLTNGLEALCRMMDTYTNPVSDPNFGGMEVRSFHKPFADFADTNNASLVTFVTFGDFCMVFPGDLERAGWEAHLQDEEFRKYLRRVKVFVASHHGREGGYLREVFDHCSPDLVVISDKAIVHGTQDHSHYNPHANGRADSSGNERNILSTRSDGAMVFWSNGTAWGFELAP